MPPDGDGLRASSYQKPTMRVDVPPRLACGGDPERGTCRLMIQGRDRAALGERRFGCRCPRRGSAVAGTRDVEGVKIVSTLYLGEDRADGWMAQQDQGRARHQRRSWA